MNQERWLLQSTTKLITDSGHSVLIPASTLKPKMIIITTYPTYTKIQMIPMKWIVPNTIQKTSSTIRNKTIPCQIEQKTSSTNTCPQCPKPKKRVHWNPTTLLHE